MALSFVSLQSPTSVGDYFLGKEYQVGIIFPRNN
jgi:hypothetical protein